MINRSKFFAVSPSSRGIRPQGGYQVTNGLEVFGRFESTYFYGGQDLVAICHQILQQSRMRSHYPPSGTMKLTSGSNQWYKWGQKTPLDPTALARPLQSDYSLVRGRLKTLKMVKIVILAPSPLAIYPMWKQIFRNTHHMGLFWGCPWTFSHREIQINKTFFLFVA